MRDGEGWGDPFLALNVYCHVPVAVLDVVEDFSGIPTSWNMSEIRQWGMDPNAFFKSRKVIEKGTLSSQA